jgi:hypothetical protein
MPIKVQYFPKLHVALENHPDSLTKSLSRIRRSRSIHAGEAAGPRRFFSAAAIQM